MARRRRSELQTFSLSFLDVVCCGFGAVILLFVLPTGHRAADRAATASEYEAGVQALGEAVTEASARGATLEENRNQLATKRAAAAQQLTESEQALIEDRQRLAQMEAEALAQAAAIKDLQAQVDALPEPPPEAKVPLPIPGTTSRQFFTDFRLDGTRTVILLEGSGGMMAETLAESIRLSARPEEEHRAGPKWTRAVAATRWILANLRQPEYFQLMVFSDDIRPLAPAGSDGWARVRDAKASQEAAEALNEWTPRGGAHFEKAFAALRSMDPPPDNIILLIDGLPTQGSLAPAGSEVDEPTRRRLLSAAARHLPPNVPVNVILFPNDGDPNAPLEWWRIALSTGGSFITPSPDWPKIE